VTELEIRPLRPDDDLDAQRDLSERAFGVMPAARREEWRQFHTALIGSGAGLGAFVRGRLAGAAYYHDMRQWWYGRSVPMAGIAGVKMSPEYRGRGIGRRMMTELLAQVAERGYPVSALWPATMPIYRSLGWELAGGRYPVTVPSREPRSLLAPDAALLNAASLSDGSAGTGAPGAAGAPGGLGGAALPGDARDLAAAANAVGIRRAGPDDAETIVSVFGQAHEAARHSGPLTFAAESFRQWLSDDTLYAYLAEDGYLAYRWNGDDEILAEHIVAASPVTYRALWSVLAGHSSTAATIRATLAPDDPLWWLTRERDVALARRPMWMLRVVDAPAAIAGRGFPPAVSLSVPLVISDPARPSNSGRWQLEVAAGKGALTPAGNGASQSAGRSSGGEASRSADGDHGALILGARGLAALYGGTPVASLRYAGLASGGSPGTDAALDAAFPGPAFVLDAF
jgi:predicted acetyltransferase